jgi:hypothetical protein
MSGNRPSGLDAGKPSAEKGTRLLPPFIETKTSPAKKDSTKQIPVQVRA